MKTTDTLLQDKQIVYFISSNSQDCGGEKKFTWPPLPDISMGEDFIQEVKAWHNQVKVWIQDNPARFKKAVNGVYTSHSTHKQSTILRHKLTGCIGRFVQDFNNSGKRVTQVKLNDGGFYFACSSEFEAA
jgi:hypothetical protein